MTTHPVMPPSNQAAGKPRTSRARLSYPLLLVLCLLTPLARAVETPTLLAKPQEKTPPALRPKSTIVPELQSLAQTQLQGLSGAIVVLDPNNGHVLALAGAGIPSEEPLSDQDKRFAAAAALPHLAIQKAASETYSPGSAFALLSILAGAQSPQFAPEALFSCAGNHHETGIPGCWTRNGHGALSVPRALAQGCYPCFVRIGLLSGFLGISEMAAHCGFGSKTGIGLENEASGALPKQTYESMLDSDWHVLSTSSITLGDRGVRVTPLQMAMFTAALANGGALLQPQILTSELPQDTPRANGNPQARRRIPVRESSIETIRDGMKRAVMDADGVLHRAQMNDLNFAAYSGVYAGARNRPEPKTGWILLFAPTQAPRYAVVIVAQDVKSTAETLTPPLTHLLRGLFRWEKASLTPAPAP